MRFQVGLNDLNKTPDPEELRSFQRQLQNVPSVSELRRKPLNQRVMSLSPAASERSLTGELTAEPSSRLGRPELSKTRSASSSGSNRTYGTEANVLSILNFMKVLSFFHSIVTSLLISLFTCFT